MAENTTDGVADMEEFDLADLLGKILAFVNHVRSSPQARTYFHKLCEEENLPPLQLLKWVRTCWASLYDLITCLLEHAPSLQQVHTPRRWMTTGFQISSLQRTYAMFRLTAREWRLLKLIRDGLREPALNLSELLTCQPALCLPCLPRH